MFADVYKEQVPKDLLYKHIHKATYWHQSVIPSCCVAVLVPVRSGHFTAAPVGQ